MFADFQTFASCVSIVNRHDDSDNPGAFSKAITSFVQGRDCQLVKHRHWLSGTLAMPCVASAIAFSAVDNGIVGCLPNVWPPPPAIESLVSMRADRSFLLVHLLLAALDHAAALGLNRPLPAIRLVHDDDVVQELAIDSGSQIERVEFVGADLLSGSIMYGQGNHDLNQFPVENTGQKRRAQKRSQKHGLQAPFS